MMKQLRKKAERGFRGYPLATVALYGPDNKLATKLVIGILRSEGAEVDPLRRWFADTGDVRSSLPIWNEVQQFLRVQGVRSYSLSEGIIGCPHEEIVDYPEGESCPVCPYWADRDRWTGELFAGEPRYLERSAVILTPKQPFLDWLSGIGVEGSPFGEGDEPSVYLLPPVDLESEFEHELEKHYARLFEIELNAWHSDPDDWPTPRTYALFRDWFDVHQHSEIIDLGEGPLLEELV